MTRVFENRPEGATTPTGWPSIPLKYLFRRSKTLGTGEERLLSIYRDYGVIPKDSRDDNFNKPSDDLSKYQVVSQGDLVVNKMKAWQGSVAVSEYDGIISPAYFVYRPMGVIDGRFAHYLLRSNEYFQYYASISSGVRPNQWDLDPRAFERLEVTIPSHEEQHGIADYLDRETAEIDAFIEDHERLLQLLDERSAVAIQTAVLGAGVATTVDTGQSWPATLPLGWTAQRVSWLFDATGSGTTPASDDADAFDGDIPWVTTGELREKAITSSEKKISLETLRQYSALRVHPAGSLLIAMYGATIGRLGWLEVPATVNQAVCVMSGYKAGPLRFPYYALLAARPYLLTLASGGGQPNINQDKIRSLRLPVPPSAEQERIVAELDHTLEAEYMMRRDVERSIELARERRSALISAAVTGQIDVTAQGVSAAEQLRDELEVHV